MAYADGVSPVFDCRLTNYSCGGIEVSLRLRVATATQTFVRLLCYGGVRLLTLEQKKAVVSQVSEVAAKAQSAIAAEYRGLTVEEMTELRVQARNAGVYLRVVKNTLARKAVEGTDLECIKDELTGPLILAFSQEDPSSAAKVIKAFSKDHEKLVVRVIAVGGKLLTPNDLDALSKMPTRDEAISILMAVMKAPTEKFVRTLAAPSTKLVRTFVALKEQKEAS